MPRQASNLGERPARPAECEPVRSADEPELRELPAEISRLLVGLVVDLGVGALRLTDSMPLIALALLS